MILHVIFGLWWLLYVKNIYDIFNSTINNKQEFCDDLGVSVPPWSHHNTRFSGQKFCEIEDLIFSIRQVISLWSFDQSVMWLWGWEPVRVSQHRAQFGFHRSSTSGGMYLIYHMNSKTICLNDYVTLWVETFHPKLPRFNFWCLLTLQWWKYSVFNLSHDLARLWLKGHVTLVGVSYGKSPSCQVWWP